eukprot:scaffold47458_cov35-Phaeocystis_antarctica.AAC.1
MGQSPNTTTGVVPGSRVSGRTPHGEPMAHSTHFGSRTTTKMTSDRPSGRPVCDLTDNDPPAPVGVRTQTKSTIVLDGPDRPVEQPPSVTTPSLKRRRAEEEAQRQRGESAAREPAAAAPAAAAASASS